MAIYHFLNMKISDFFVNSHFKSSKPKNLDLMDLLIFYTTTAPNEVVNIPKFGFDNLYHFKVMPFQTLC